MRKALGLLAFAVGVFVMTLSVRADPTPCTDSCKQASTGYWCTSGQVWVFQLTHCLPCSGIPGWTICQPPADGGTCTPTEMEIPVTAYKKGFEVCPTACQKKDTDTGKSTPLVVEGMPQLPVDLEFNTKRSICKVK